MSRNLGSMSTFACTSILLASVALGDLCNPVGNCSQPAPTWLNAASGPQGLNCDPGCFAQTTINALEAYGGFLYAGGTFDASTTVNECSLGNSNVRKLARWNGTAWESIFPAHNGLQGGDVNCMLIVPSSLPSGTPGGVPDGLYIGGSFECLDGDDPNGVDCPHTSPSQYSAIIRVNPNGSVATLAVRPIGSISAMAVYENHLCVGGTFSGVTQGNSSGINQIACWDGEVWHALNAGLSGPNGSPGEVRALAIFDEDGDGPGRAHLYAGGNLSIVLESTTTLRGLARWVPNDDSEPFGPGNWESVGFGVSECVGDGFGVYPGIVNALAAYDDGTGEALFVGGKFCGVGTGGAYLHGVAGPQASRRLAKWTGSAWDTGWDVPSQPAYNFRLFPASSQSEVCVLRVFPDWTKPNGAHSLFIGGRFKYVKQNLNEAGNLAILTARHTFGYMGGGARTEVCAGELPVVRAIALQSIETPESIALVVGGDFREVKTFPPVTTYDAFGIARWGKLDSDADHDGVPNGCDCGVGDNAVDSDNDGVPNPCDRCPGFDDSDDVDNDCVPFMCDNCPFIANSQQGSTDCAPAPSGGRQLLEVIEGGKVIDNFEYEDGVLARRFRGNPDIGSHTLETEYVYDSNGFVEEEVTRTFPINPNKERRRKVVRDPNYPEEVMGRVFGDGSSGGCGCVNGGKFRWRNDRGLTEIITAASENPLEAAKLDEFTYEENSSRLKYHHRYDSAGIKRLVEYRQYDTGTGLCTERIGIFRATSSCQNCYEATVECYNESGSLTKREDYLDPVPLGQVQGPYAVTEYTTETDLDINGEVVRYRRTELRPSGDAIVNEWRVFGGPYATGSYKIIQSYRTLETLLSNQTDETKVDRRVERHDFSPLWGDYRLTTVTDPNGAITEYQYDDSNGKPRRVVRITKSAPTGISVSAGTETTFSYVGNSGHVDTETTTGPNGAVSTHYTYDDFWQVLSKTIDYLGEDARTTHYRYNSFGEQDRVQSPAHLVHATVFDNSGRREEEYSCEFAGSLDGFVVDLPPVPVLELTNYDYHSVSGAVKKQKVANVDYVPFERDDITELDFAVTESIYDATGEWLLERKHPELRVGEHGTQYTYDLQKRVIQTTSAEGVVSSTVYDGRGQAEKTLIRDSATSTSTTLTTTREFDGDGRLVKETGPDGVRNDLVYGWVETPPLPLREVVRRKRYDNIAQGFTVETVLTHDAASNVVKQEVVDLAASVTLSLVESEFDNYGRAYRVRQRADALAPNDSLDLITLTEFNAAGLVSRTAQKMNASIDSIDEYVDRVVRYAYTDLGELETETLKKDDCESPPCDELTLNEYDPAGRKERVTVAYGSLNLTTSFEYDALGRVTKTVDPEWHYAEQFYDSRGNVVRRLAYQDDDGNGSGSGVVKMQERFAYDDAGRLESQAVMKDADSPLEEVPEVARDRIVEYTYDDDNRLVDTTTYVKVAGTNTAQVTHRDYDDVGRLKKTTDAGGNYEELFYLPDSSRLDKRRISDIGDITGTNVRTIKNLEFDGLGRVKKVQHEGLNVQAITIEQNWDGLDRVALNIDGKGTKTRYVFDLLGRQTDVFEADTVQDVRRTQSVFDRLGRLTMLKAFGDGANPAIDAQVTTYTYDLAGRRRTMHLPDSSGPLDRVEWQYDLAGRLSKKIDQRGVTIDFGYDKRGLSLTKISSGVFPSVTDTYAYDGLGRMTLAKRVTNNQATPDSEVTFVHNDLSQLTQETQKLFGDTTPTVINFADDPAGHRISRSVSYPTVSTLGYTYDILGRVATITQGGAELATYTYNGLFPKKRSVKTVATAATYINYEAVYDGHRRLYQAINRNQIGGVSVGLAIVSYPSRDNVGNPLTMQKAGLAYPTSYSESYDYDNLHRLLTTTYVGAVNGTETFTMDKLGNRTDYADSRDGPTFDYGENNDANEYASIQYSSGSSPVALSYDAAGNLLSNERGYQFTYDHENRLTSVSTSGELQIASYNYDALGRRIREIRNVTTDPVRWFIYDGQRVLAEIRPDGTAIRRFIDGPLYIDEHVLMEETSPANTFYYLLGNLYTVLGVANKNGDLAASYHYDSYGWLARRGGGVSGGGGGGSRLLSLKPEAGDGPVALLVTGSALQPDIACYQGYVQANGTIGEEAVFLTPEEWGTVSVSGEGIIPERTYSVQVDKGTIEEPLLGEAVEFTTWKWGDVANGQGEPIGDGMVDVNDLLCTLEGFDEPVACASANQKPCGQIDDTTNLDDLLVFSAAFAGETYPVSCAAAYPPTCPPSGTIVPPTNQPYYFTGQRLDFDERNTTTNEPYLALYHYRARAYDPVHGRFLQRDPLEYIAGLNQYEYVYSDPLYTIDPYGLAPKHHWFSQAHWVKLDGLSKEVRQVFDETIPLEHHKGFPTEHRIYNDAVGSIKDKFLQSKGKSSLTELTVDEAKDLVNKIKTSKDPAIKMFVDSGGAKYLRQTPAKAGAAELGSAAGLGAATVASAALVVLTTTAEARAGELSYWGRIRWDRCVRCKCTRVVTTKLVPSAWNLFGSDDVSRFNQKEDDFGYILAKDCAMKEWHDPSETNAWYDGGSTSGYSIYWAVDYGCYDASTSP